MPAEYQFRRQLAGSTSESVASNIKLLNMKVRLCDTYLILHYKLCDAVPITITQLCLAATVAKHM
eukprot:5395-Heterococcus_DN1.PRE.4